MAVPSESLQDGFEPTAPRRSLTIALLKAREALMERFRPMLNGLGVTEQQWRVLRVLYEDPGIDATLLAQRACILAPSLTRILKSLDERGLVSANRDSRDARRAVLSLTDEGRAFIHDAIPSMSAIYGEIEAAAGVERIGTLIDEIEALLAALDRS